MSIFNIGNSYRTVSNHITTYHVLKVASRRATDKIVGSPGAFGVADLAVGETFGCRRDRLHHGEGALARSAVVVVEHALAAAEMDVLGLRVDGEDIGIAIVGDRVEVADEADGKDVGETLLVEKDVQAVVATEVWKCAFDVDLRQAPVE